MLQRLGCDRVAPAIAMYVNAKDERKRWPVERFVDVARSLSRGTGRQIWLIGGPDDVGASQRVSDALPKGHAIVLAGHATVRMTLAALSECNLFVGNDGSPTHFAALCGCPCVTVYCNWEVPGIWEPIAAPCSRSLRPAWSITREHGDFGITTISTVHVLKAIERIVAAPSGHFIETIRASDDEPEGDVTAQVHPSRIDL
jgi:ADP-heptose:LPS heptosyltransferase